MILLNDFSSDNGLKYYLYSQNINNFNFDNYDLSKFFEILLEQELLYLTYTLNIDWKEEINSDYHNHISVNIFLKENYLYIHLSNTTSKRARKWLWSEIIQNFIRSIKEFNKNNLKFKFKDMEWYINPDELVINLDWLKSFYEHNWFKIYKDTIWNYFCKYSFL